jgi:hypothetical protein
MTTAIVRFDRVPSDDPAACKLERVKEYALNLRDHAQVLVGYQPHDTFVEFQLHPQVQQQYEATQLGTVLQRLKDLAGTLPSVVEYR